MKIAISVFGLAACLFLAGLAQGQESKEKVKLPFNVEKGKSYVFQVTPQAETGASTLPGRTGTTPGSSDSDSEDAEKGKSPGTEPEETPRKTESAGALGRAGEGDAMEYRFQVQDKTAEETTFRLTVGKAMSSPGTSPGSTPGSRGTTPGTKPGESPGGESRTGASAGATGMGPFGITYGTYTVKVDREGKVKDIQGPERAGASSPGASQGQPGQPGQPGQASRTGGGALMMSPLRQHLDIVCASGLHTEELEVGKTYTCKSSTAGATPGTGGTSSPGQPGQPGQSGQAGSQQGGLSSGASQHTDLSMVKLRFEGVTRQGDQQLARFTILGPAAGAGTSRPGSSEESKRPGEAGTPGINPSGAGGERLGEATYRVNDGILERVSFSFPASSGRAIEPSSAGKPRGLTIRRIQADAGSREIGN